MKILFVTAINESPELAQRGVSAINVAFDPQQEWSTIRFGVYPNARGLQVFDQPAAEAMVTAFNSLGNQLADAFRGLPGYIGHPDDPEWAKQNPGVRMEALSRIKEMRVTPQGLQFRTAYNDQGKKVLQGDAPAFEAYSPNWGMRPIIYQGRQAFRPVELYSIGYTNKPNIPGTLIGLNEALPPENKNQSAMKLKVIALLAALGRPVANPTAVTDEQLESAINEATPVATKLVTDAAALPTAVNEASTLRTQLTAAQGQVTTAVNESSTLRTSLATERAARAGVVLVGAINEGRITEAQRAEWLGKFTAPGADFAAVQADLGKLAKAVNTQSKANIGDRRGQPGDQGKVRAINEAVSSYKQAHPGISHMEAYNAVQRDPKHEALFTNDKSA